MGFGSFVKKVGGAVGGGVKTVGRAAGGAVGGITQAGRYVGQSVDITNRGSVFGRGLTAASRVPGMSSALTMATGGLAALNPDVAGGAAREFATGAAVGGGVLASQALAPRSAPAAGETSPGGLDAIDAAQGGGGSSWWQDGARLVTDRLGSATNRGVPTSAGELEALDREAGLPDSAAGAKPGGSRSLLLAGGLGLVLLAVVLFVFAPRRR